LEELHTLEDLGDPNRIKTDAFGNIGHYSAQSSPEIGRGVFAGQFIPKGTLVYVFSFYSIYG